MCGLSHYQCFYAISCGFTFSAVFEIDCLNISIQVYLYSAKLQHHLSQGALYCSVKIQYSEESSNNEQHVVRMLVRNNSLKREKGENREMGQKGGRR